MVVGEGTDEEEGAFSLKARPGRGETAADGLLTGLWAELEAELEAAGLEAAGGFLP